MDIRYCEKKDLSGVFDLLQELTGGKLEFSSFKKIYAQNIKNEKYHYWVAVAEDKIYGFISAYIGHKLHHVKKVCVIEELIVNKNVRRNGIGNQLMHKVLELYEENDCEILELVSKFIREEAHKFYEKFGFKKEGYKFALVL